MEQKRIDVIANYYERVNKASKELTKKEHFKDLLNRLYANSQDFKDIINQMSDGAERSILSIPRYDKIATGRADTMYNNIIIEFENDLRKTESHAKEQLAGYLLGQYNSGEGYNYTLIASDFITWKVYYLETSQIDKIDKLKEHEVKLIENKEASFVLTPNNFDDFYFWLDQYLFREEKQKATLKSIELAFGYKSPTFIEAYRVFYKWFEEAKKYGEIQVSLEQWRRFLSIAYGKFEGGDEMFIIHTYLSVFAKLLAYSVVSGVEFVREDVLKGVLDGVEFKKFKIDNFVENDFFHWVKSERNFPQLIKAFRVISQEIARFDFDNVEEDILKGVYQELIDLDTRHALGEYYTPDWLCERVVSEFTFGREDKILDPSCGSGSFLRAAISRLKVCNPGIEPHEIGASIFGIDIHPLSVQIAKTTLVLALGNQLKNAKRPVRLNVLMANTLLSPEGEGSIFKEEVALKIDKSSRTINSVIFSDSELFDKSIDLCESLASADSGKSNRSSKDFSHVFTGNFPSVNDKRILSSFYEIYKGLKEVKERGRDTIWKFILTNIYRPYFMREQFDYVIGNPPWFTYSSIKNEEYQNLLMRLATSYNVKPKRAANMPHLEIAAIFMAYSAGYFLRSIRGKQGKLAFVLPRSFFSADQHENTRSGLAKGFRLDKVWDLNDVSPLFRIPSAVFFATKAPVKTEWEGDSLPGLEFSGKVPYHNCNWEEAAPFVVEESVSYYLRSLGKATALSTSNEASSNKENPYKELFKQGATIVPRTLYFVESHDEWPEDMTDREMYLYTAKSVLADAKKPWKDLLREGPIESKYLFYTALSKSILPYAIVNPDVVTLPLKVVEDEGTDSSVPMDSVLGSEKSLGSSNKSQRFSLLTPEEILGTHIRTSKWFFDNENLWKIHRTSKSEKMTAIDRINYQRGITSQDINKRYLVLYNASAKDANAGVLDRTSLNLPFVVESKAYVYYTDSSVEASYLMGFLNSTYANAKIKDFQSKGLFGARDVHKKILDVYFPQFDASNKKHLDLAEAASKLANKVQKFLVGKSLPKDSTPRDLGVLRREIKTKFHQELAAIDSLVAEIAEG